MDFGYYVLVVLSVLNYSKINKDTVGGKSPCKDPSLAEMFDNTLSSTDTLSTTRGYFVQDSVLYPKWVPHGDGFVGQAFIQVVVPTTYCSSVLQVAHSGHSRVRKTYDHFLRHFFWPRLKKDVGLY